MVNYYTIAGSWLCDKLRTLQAIKKEPKAPI